MSSKDEIAEDDQKKEDALQGHKAEALSSDDQTV